MTDGLCRRVKGITSSWSVAVVVPEAAAVSVMVIVAMFVDAFEISLLIETPPAPLMGLFSVPLGIMFCCSLIVVEEEVKDWGCK